MNLLVAITHLLMVFFLSLGCLLIARQLAPYIGLVDKPDHRKRHQGLIPLVGGISVYAGIFFSFFMMDKHPIAHANVYLACASLLVITGLLDDRFHVSIKIRLLVQALVSILMIFSSGLHLDNLGGILGLTELKLGPFSNIITLLCVWAVINAFNMIDGIDGLLGGLSCISFAAIGFLLYKKDEIGLAFCSFSIIAALAPYMLFNLGLLGEKYKVFMGDSGSTLIGFTIMWFILETTQGERPFIYPVTGLWIIAIPLIDMVAIIYRRLRKRVNPFFPDRQHLHHLMVRAGFTSRQTLIFISFFAVLCALIGITLDSFFVVPEWIIFISFLCLFFVYHYFIKVSWRLARCIKRINMPPNKDGVV